MSQKLRAHLRSVQRHSEAPAVCQVGAYGLCAAEGVGMVVYGDGLVMLRQLQNLHHRQGCYTDSVQSQSITCSRLAHKSRSVCDVNRRRTCVSGVCHLGPLDGWTQGKGIVC